MAAFARGRYSMGDREAPSPHATRSFPPDRDPISTFAIIFASSELAPGTKEGIKMYKIVWLNSNVEPVPGYRTDNKGSAKKLVDAWNINFDSKLEVVVA